MNASLPASCSFLPSGVICCAFFVFEPLFAFPGPLLLCIGTYSHPIPRVVQLWQLGFIPLQRSFRPDLEQRFLSLNGLMIRCQRLYLDKSCTQRRSFLHSPLFVFCRQLPLDRGAVVCFAELAWIRRQLSLSQRSEPLDSQALL